MARILAICITLISLHYSAYAGTDVCPPKVQDAFMEQQPDQPKLTIGLYAHSEGIETPRIFTNIREALALNIPLIFRSEHPDEYNGPSGIMSSLIYSEHDLPGCDRVMLAAVRKLVRGFKLGFLSEAELQEGFLELADADLKKYTKLAGLDYEAYRSKVSFSAWEKLEGINMAVVADSAIEGRYHVFADFLGATGLQIENYAVVDQSKVIDGRYTIDPTMRADPDFAKITQNPLMQWFESNQESFAQAAINFYKSVQRLSKFDPNHIPIIEMQYFNGKFYFLQYHRTRDREKADFVLPQVLGGKWIAASYVRGVTPKDGVVVEVKPSDTESNPTLAFEFQSRNRIAYIFNGPKKELVGKAATRHMRRTTLFKPRITLAVDLRKVVGPRVFTRAMRDERDGDQSLVKPFRIRIISDGNRAFVRAEKSR